MRVSFLTLAALLTFACTAETEQQAPKIAKTSEQALETSTFRLPVSINDVMVALVNDAADPIWMAAWKEPESEADWRELERRAYQLQLAGALIEHPGTGALDHKWAAKPTWSRWSQQLRDTGIDAVAATQNRDLGAISGIGDQLVEICEGCHIDFKLPHPTGGKYGELTPAPSDVYDD